MISELASSSWTSTALVSVSEDAWLSTCFSMLAKSGVRVANVGDESESEVAQQKVEDATVLINIRSPG